MCKNDGNVNIALSLLPENVLPQWQQKIALRAENKACPYSEIACGRMDFLRIAQFFAGIGPAHYTVINVKAPGQPIFTLIGHHLRHPFFFDSASKSSF